jgi:hypothetical protein
MKAAAQPGEKRGKDQPAAAESMFALAGGAKDRLV